MVDRTYSNIDHNVEETEEMRVNLSYISGNHKTYFTWSIHFTASVKGNLFMSYESKDNSS